MRPTQRKNMVYRATTWDKYPARHIAAMDIVPIAPNSEMLPPEEIAHEYLELHNVRFTGSYETGFKVY